MTGKKGTSWKAIAEKDIILIKTLSDAGLTRSKIQKITGRGAGTIISALEATNLEDYKRITRESRVKYQPEPQPVAKPVAEPAVSIEEVMNGGETKQAEPQAKFYTATEQGAIELTRIADALERLGDLWEATPTKRKLF